MLLWRHLVSLLLITVHVLPADSCEEFTDLNLAHAIIGTEVRVKLLLYTRESGKCGALLSHTHLTYTHLTPTNLTPTNLTPTNPTPTNLTPTNLTPTNLTPTNPTPTNLTPTNLTPTNPTPTNPTPSNLTPTNLTPSNLTPTNLTPTNLTPTNLTPTNLTPTNPTLTNPTPTNPTLTNPTPTNPTPTNPTLTNLTPTNLTPTNPTPTNLTPTNLTPLNLSRPTTFILHGFRPTGSPPVWVDRLTEVLLARDDLNVIVVDWNYGAANVNYLKAVENTQKTADNLTAFIRLMQEGGASLSDVHMIGVSLGAHISGFVGANLNSSIGRITALDPAGPLFTGRPPEGRLDPGDAQFVDALHTDIDALGFREPLAHVDFYANGGTDQPGCPRTVFSGGSYFKCDHQRSVLLFLDSVQRRCSSRAYHCSSYTHFLDGECLDCSSFGEEGCPEFGYDVTKWKDVLLKLGQTKMFFTTNKQSPFCMTYYRVDVLIWNKDARWGSLTVKLYSGGEEAQATMDHKSWEFRRFWETRMFAQFPRSVAAVERVSLQFSTGKVLQPKRTLRVLRIRLTALEGNERPLCRYDVLLEENREVSFRPLTCEESTL